MVFVLGVQMMFLFKFEEILKRSISVDTSC